MKTIHYEPVGNKVQWVIYEHGKPVSHGPPGTMAEAKSDWQRTVPYLVDVKK